MVSVDAPAWRRRWRAIGLGADKLLPIGYTVLAPSFQQLNAKITSSLIVPGNGRWTFTDEDTALILEGSVFAMAFIAESMLVQVVVTDTKLHLPDLHDCHDLHYGTNAKSSECVFPDPWPPLGRIAAAPLHLPQPSI